MILRGLLILALLVAALGVAAGAYVRLAPMDPGIWHADPTLGSRTGKPNDYLVGPGGDQPALPLDGDGAALLARLDTLAMAEARTVRLAGDVGSGWVTYVQRSALMAYPDAISVKVTELDGGSTLSMWSRSRYGHSDLGVNSARVARWLSALDLPASGE